MQGTQTFFGNIRSDVEATNCGFDPVQAAADARQAMREAVTCIDALKLQADADAQAVKALEAEYNACYAKAAEILPRMLEIQVKAGRSGQAYGRALEFQKQLEREKQVGGV